MFVSPGTTITKLSQTPTEMAYELAFDQLRNALLAIHGHPKGMVDAGSYATLYAALKQFTLFAVQPVLNLLAEEDTEQLAPEFGEALSIVMEAQAVNDEELLERKLQTDIQAKVRTRNEFRTLRGLDLLEGPQGEELIGALAPQQATKPGDPLAGIGPKSLTKDCGTGAGGFQPGNTCQGEGGGGASTMPRPKFNAAVDDAEADGKVVVFHTGPKEINSLNMGTSTARDESDSTPYAEGDRAFLHAIVLDSDASYADSSDLKRVARELENTDSYEFEMADSDRIRRALINEGFDVVEYRDVGPDNEYEHDTLLILNPDKAKVIARTPINTKTQKAMCPFDVVSRSRKAIFCNCRQRQTVPPRQRHERPREALAALGGLAVMPELANRQRLDEELTAALLLLLDEDAAACSTWWAILRDLRRLPPYYFDAVEARLYRRLGEGLLPVYMQAARRRPNALGVEFREQEARRTFAAWLILQIRDVVAGFIANTQAARLWLTWCSMRSRSGRRNCGRLRRGHGRHLRRVTGRKPGGHHNNDRRCARRARALYGDSKPRRDAHGGFGTREAGRLRNLCTTGR